MEHGCRHQVPTRREVDEVFYAGGAEHGGKEVAGREEFAYAGEAEEDGADVVGEEGVFDEGRVLDGAGEDGDAGGDGDLGGEAGRVGGGQEDGLDFGGSEEERDEGEADVA